MKRTAEDKMHKAVGEEIRRELSQACCQFHDLPLSADSVHEKKTYMRPLAKPPKMQLSLFDTSDSTRGVVTLFNIASILEHVNFQTY
jgi:hypothetical protein